MKVRLDLDDSYQDVEVIIKTSHVTDRVRQIQEMLLQLEKSPLSFYKGTSEYFIKLEEILFFETNSPKLFAHTKDEAYEVKLKLYELESYLPNYFCRVAKATIVNTRSIYALERSFSGTSTIQFYKTHKKVHVSRHYYHVLKETLREVK
ncbi:LytTR family DNA-binding domain-containing protein [Streptococcus ictaluri]|uniref:LytTr DNA-binding domain protein n=1 Tax=Streptococcus ictaluri 707-05 TaxID=764299 RepID=G5JZK8_9STRE|nr:LytTR family DNA-binding domain-containing protein [Streptococcus ictaluri]EHI70957.1 LytTr DNA-binding domain protein [Streptococcus ictaluri 707-05]